jgi:hypothetical protein
MGPHLFLMWQFSLRNVYPRLEEHVAYIFRVEQLVGSE